MLDAVIDYLRNDFRVRMTAGTFAIEGGRLDVPELAIPEGAYIRIFGSVFNDGIHLYGDDDLTDETFDGTVWLLAIPTELLQLVSKIEADVAAGASTNTATPFKSESFDGYSYTRMTRADGSLMDWRDLYRDRLARWRKI
jgi:hypothetical protein